MLEMPEDQYSFLEYQANQFAGRLLVPPEELSRSFDNVICEAERKVPRSKIGDAHLDYLCIPIAKYFQVSGEVVRRRLRDEQLWPLFGG
jgi:Zn-dependent peptidase ImmA (M78 family)